MLRTLARNDCVKIECIWPINDRLSRTNILPTGPDTLVMKLCSIGLSLASIIGIVIPSAFAATDTNVVQTGDFVIANASFVNQTYTDLDSTKYTLMGLLSNPSNKTIGGADVFIQAFNENDDLIVFNN